MPHHQAQLQNSASREVFDTARRRAWMQDILSELGGRSDDLLSFEDVRQRLRLREPVTDSSLQDIDLTKIVGSVGRYRDFNRAFLPRSHVSAERWTRVEQLQSKTRLPPIDVFKVGQVFFVRDGNHRVSVARARNQKTIRARVLEVPARVPLGPDTSPDDLILKSGYAEFLEGTSLDRLCPDQCIEITRAGGYRKLLQHIEVHQFYMGLRSRTYPTLGETAVDWYRKVYQPLVERIVNSGILSHFPGRSEADLYLWIAENQARLQMQYGGAAKADEAVATFEQEHRAPAPLLWLRRLLHRLLPRIRRGQPEP